MSKAKRGESPVGRVEIAVMRLLEKTRWTEKLPQMAAKLFIRMTTLYGGKSAEKQVRLFAARAVLRSTVCILGMTALGFVSGDISAFTLAGLLLGIVVPLRGYLDLDRQIKRRRQRIVLDLPEYVDKLVLLMNAGEAVQQALLRCVSAEKAEAGHPLYKELQQMANELHNNRSFPQAMEDLSRRVGVQEVSMFASALLVNVRRGGDELVHAMRELSRMLWDKRLATAKTLGEEATSKLVFPMVLIFGVVMLVVGAPAVLLMNQQ